VLGCTYWNKASENEVISRVLGARVYTDHGKAWVRHNQGESPLSEAPELSWCHKAGKYIQSTEKPNPSIFIRTAQGGLQMLNTPTLATHVVNRKAANQIRARYAEGISYVKALAKLRRDSWPKWDEIAEVFSERLAGTDPKYYWQRREVMPNVMQTHYFKHAHAQEIVNLLASPEPGEQYKAFLWLGHGTGDTYIAKCIDRVLAMHHHNEWFMMREVPAGLKRHDRYVWAFPERTRKP
jgi:hypothetical protein